MKRTIITLLVQTLSILIIYAQPRSENEALSIAQDFFGKVAESRGGTHGEACLTLVSPTEIAKAIGRDMKQTKRAASASSVNVGFYIFNDDANHRFVIVSGDERQYETLGSSDNGVFDPSNVPCGLLTFLEQYADEYDYLQELEGNGVATGTTSEVRKAYSSTSPLIKTKWDQDEPYNYLCPIVNGNQLCLTGCVATAMAQVMNYHQYPERGEGIVYNIGGKNNLPYESVDLSFIPFEWNYLVGAEKITKYSSSNTKFAVAELMRACGYSVEMDYGTSQQGSGANPANIPPALINKFGYNRGVTLIRKSYYDWSTWDSIIQEELSKKRPIIYCGYKNNGGGHCFILDGYQDSSGKYYFNWGWSGSYDGAFYLTSLRPGNYNYTNNQLMVYNIYPETENLEQPVITIDRDFDVATISCSTQEAKLYYSFTPQDQSFESSYSRYYGSKIDITCNGTLRAYAELWGKQVYAAEKEVTWFVVEKPEFYPDGNKLTIKCPSATTIYYTKDGKDPTKNSSKYTGSITCTDGMTVKAIGVKANYSDSYTATYEYKEEIKTVYNINNTAGHLEETIGWNNRNNVISLTVSGQLNHEDMFLIRIMSSEGALTRIDLKNATIDSKGKDYTFVPDYIVPDYAFRDGSNLTSIVLPSNTIEIGDHAFMGCTALAELQIPASCKIIGGWAFADSGIKSLVIPKAVESVGSGIVQGCKSLISIIVEEGNEYYDSRDNCNAIIKKEGKWVIAGCMRTVIPTSVWSIDAWSFCSSPAKLIIPSNIGSVFNEAFEDNETLEEVIIEDGDWWWTLYLSLGAFKGCKSLKSVTLPSRVYNISEEAFADCTCLRQFTIDREEPLEIEESVFAGSSYKSATLRVPYGCKSKYQSAAVWKDFKTIEEMPIVVNSIAEVKTLDYSQDATLKLDEAQVIYAYQDGIDYVFLRDKTGAECLFGTDIIARLNIKVGDIISGDIPFMYTGVGILWDRYRFEPGHFSVTGHQAVVPKAVTLDEVGNEENDFDLIAVENVELFGSDDYLFFNTSNGKDILVAPISGLKPEDYDAIVASVRNVDLNGGKYNLVGIQKNRNTLYLTQPAKKVTQDSPIKGDVNGDGAIDVADISAIINVMAGLDTENTVKSADVNNDGIVDVADISKVIIIMSELARLASE